MTREKPSKNIYWLYFVQQQIMKIVRDITQERKGNKKRKITNKKVNTHRFRETAVMWEYQIIRDSGLENILKQKEIEETWENYKSCMSAVARDSCGVTKTRKVERKITAWWTISIKIAVREKKAAWMVYPCTKENIINIKSH